MTPAPKNKKKNSSNSVDPECNRVVDGSGESITTPKHMCDQCMPVILNRFNREVGRLDGGRLDGGGSDSPHHVECFFCLSQGPEAETLEEAVELWNERIPLSEIDRLVRNKYEIIKWVSNKGQPEPPITHVDAVGNCIQRETSYRMKCGFNPLFVTEEGLLISFIKRKWASLPNKS